MTNIPDIEHDILNVSMTPSSNVVNNQTSVNPNMVNTRSVNIVHNSLNTTSNGGTINNVKIGEAVPDPSQKTEELNL